ncbi:uncharacterized protein TNCT_276841 [Trichonephila clavata]|uniref:Uncharacterized protein n=1 Tax=Trichonephila clavata TaxID=2740835 RepID=A0A8X6I2F0_TRICU|nr:uncharacterized protein TNCT_276841 [Trichonephila clavata]
MALRSAATGSSSTEARAKDPVASLWDSRRAAGWSQTRFRGISSPKIRLDRVTKVCSRRQPHRRVVALISEYRQKRYRSVWFREYDEYGGNKSGALPLQNHVDKKNGTATTPPSGEAHLAAREALQETANDSCKTAAIPLELSRIESGERRQSSGYPPAQLSRTSLLGKPLKSGRHRGPRYRKSQAVVYNFLERPRGYKSAFYHILL